MDNNDIILGKNDSYVKKWIAFLAIAVIYL